ncbi:MAG TPA: cell division protein SepF [Armatimonadota bacterium]|jgi:FtsZ-interacting cell division protein YlmF
MPKTALAQVRDFFGLAPLNHRPSRRTGSHLNSEDAYYNPENDVIEFPRTTDNINCPIVRAEPRNLDEATVVADEIKHQNPVVLNLESVDKAEARRIVDFLGGVTYGLNGYMRRLSSWVYICAPFDMPVEKLVLDPSRQGRDRFELEREDSVAQL